MSTIALPTSALRKRSRRYWETRPNVKGQHAPTRNNQSQKIYFLKNHLLFRISAVTGRYGPNFRPSPWIFTYFCSSKICRCVYEHVRVCADECVSADESARVCVDGIVRECIDGSVILC